MGMKAALVDTKTNMVIALIMVNSLNDPVMHNTRLVEVPAEPSKKQTDDMINQIIDFIKNNNDELDLEKLGLLEKGPAKMVIHPGTTHWSEGKGFYVPDPEPTERKPEEYIPEDE